jgi:hypothetical protein
MCCRWHRNAAGLRYPRELAFRRAGVQCIRWALRGRQLGISKWLCWLCGFYRCLARAHAHVLFAPVDGKSALSGRLPPLHLLLHVLFSPNLYGFTCFIVFTLLTRSITDHQARRSSDKSCSSFRCHRFTANPRLLYRSVMVYSPRCWLCIRLPRRDGYLRVEKDDSYLQDAHPSRAPVARSISSAAYEAASSFQHFSQYEGRSYRRCTNGSSPETSAAVAVHRHNITPRRSVDTII